MKFSRIYLGDFGIFQNVSMDNIGKGIVVIGGRNRAGKTTFMSALRFLGYKVPKSPGVPSPIYKYDVKADVAREGLNYRISLEGHGKPKVVPVGHNDEKTLEELYNHLDRFTYKQLYTISLDELRKIPDNINEKDMDRITTVLLGAGWEDVLRLQEIKDYLNKEAYKIGGKEGSLYKGNFKNSYNKMKEGIELREKVNAEIDTYETKCGRLKELKVNIPSLEERIKKERIEAQRLELIKEHFDRYLEYKSKNMELKEKHNKLLLKSYPGTGKGQAERLKIEYQNTLKEEERIRSHFTAITGFEPEAKIYDSLIKHQKEINEFKVKVSGWEVSIDNYKRETEELDKRKKALYSDIKGISGIDNKKEGLTFIDIVKAGRINDNNLKSIVKSYVDLTDDYRRKENEISHLEYVIGEKINQLEKIPPLKDNLLTKVSLMFGVDVLAAASLSLILPAEVSLTFGIAGAAAIMSYFLRQNSTEQPIIFKKAELEKEISDYKGEKQALVLTKDDLNGKIKAVESSISNLKSKYHIPDKINIFCLPDFIREMRDLQREHEKVVSKEESLDDLKADIDKDFTRVLPVLIDIGLLEQGYECVFRNKETVLRKLEKSFDYLETALAYEAIKKKKKEIEGRILKLLKQGGQGEEGRIENLDYLSLLDDFVMLGEKFEELREKKGKKETLQKIIESYLYTERWGPLFEDREGEVNLITSFGLWCEKYSSPGEVKGQHEEAIKAVKKLEVELQDLIEEKRDLEKEVEELASDEKLTEAIEIIDSGRRELGNLVEEYTINRISALMVEKLSERLIDRTRNGLLESANDVFCRITGSEYKGIELPPDKLKETEFMAVCDDKGYQEVNDLSRATREQLFLSIRLSRIKDIQPELPVILDDTFANFDPLNAREAIKYLLELSKTHQVFVLTCHPEFLDCLAPLESIRECQFWGIQEGKFCGPYTEGSKVRDLLINPY
ncbi:MAG: hypothetical protein D5S00_02985 [Tindallia sp. MSAO_Bac2]|nr:MAG: hypothetical protein D5S00_02985 [Tindallia sp. MSAO_Bac2]